jgi:hypothetical protein
MGRTSGLEVVRRFERLGQTDVVVKCCDISFELSVSGWVMLISQLQMDLNQGDLFLDDSILVVDSPYLLTAFLKISFVI